MRVFISADWEGTAGVVHWAQEQDAADLYRMLMTEEVNAAVEGALAGGAEEVLVNDAHGSMRNLLPDRLHREARLISGSLKELCMVQGVQKDVDAAVFVGYHSRMGTCAAVLDHTYSDLFSEVRLNGQPVGETRISAGVCGYFGVPVVAVTGDDSLAEEVEAIGARHAVVKHALSRYSACSLHPEKARDVIRTVVQSAVVEHEQFVPFVVAPPVTLEMEFRDSAMVQGALLIPNMLQIGPRTVAFTHDDFVVVFKVMRAAVTLGADARS